MQTHERGSDVDGRFVQHEDRATVPRATGPAVKRDIAVGQDVESDAQRWMGCLGSGPTTPVSTSPDPSTSNGSPATVTLCLPFAIAFNLLPYPAIPSGSTVLHGHLNRGADSRTVRTAALGLWGHDLRKESDVSRTTCLTLPVQPYRCRSPLGTHSFTFWVSVGTTNGRGLLRRGGQEGECEGVCLCLGMVGFVAICQVLPNESLDLARDCCDLVRRQHGK